jgi:hypothetical protein
MTDVKRYRDLRRPRVAAALGALSTLRDAASASRARAAAADHPDANALSTLDRQIADLDGRIASLKREAAALDGPDWSVADITFELVAKLRIWEGGPNLLEEVMRDPVREVLGEPSPVDAPTRDWLTGMPRVPVDPPGDLLAKGLQIAAGSTAIVDELVFAGFRSWVALEQPYPFEDVGVLLPVRLETLFDTTPAGETLTLRILPDVASILRDNPNVSEEEVFALQQFWAQAKPSAPLSPSSDPFPAGWLAAPEGITAWGMLCDRIGPRRASWLAAAFPPALAGADAVVTVPASAVQAPLDNRVSGLPPIIAVSAVTTAGMTIELGRLTRSVAAPAGPIPVPMPGKIADITESWWGDFGKARDLGLADVFPLPAGVTRTTIEALYVVGIGDESPAAHFRAQGDSGEMGFLRLGAATNSVRGAQGAELGRDPETWRLATIRRLVAGAVPGGTVGIDSAQLDAAHALIGAGAALPYVPGSSTDLRDAKNFVRALWPTLWGHYLRDIWGLGDAAHEAGLWAFDHLAPEGPLLPLRIDDQPYGLLPATSLSTWTPAGTSPAAHLEVEMAKRLIPMRDAWSNAARARGNVVNGDTEKLLEMLGRDGVTSRYLHRHMLSTDVLHLLYPAAPTAKIEELGKRAAEQAIQTFDRPPARLHLPSGWPQRLRLPLIVPTRRPARRGTGMVRIGELLDNLFRGLSVQNVYLEFLDRVVPDSLLIRLMIESLVMYQAWYMLSVTNDQTPLLNDPASPDPRSIVERKRDGFTASVNAGAGSQAMNLLWKNAFNALREIARDLDGQDPPDRVRIIDDPKRPGQQVAVMNFPPEKLAQWDRAMRATLDTATHRLDPWIVGIAHHRLTDTIAGIRGRHRLGVFGWVDGPFPGQPGPNAAGLLHAPSKPQAITSIVLRDKFLSSAGEVDAANPRNLWDMNIDSRKARVARQIAEDARFGMHLMEIVGRRIEAVIGTNLGVKSLRLLIPMEPGKRDRNAVCNGLLALKALRGQVAPGLVLDAAGTAELAALRAGLSSVQTEVLDLIDASLDAYGDLLVADAVHSVVTGHPDLASQIMDATAGLDRPPTFESLDTPPSGYILATAVISVFPAEAPSASPTAHPCRIAEASLAAYIDRQFPSPADRGWTIRYLTGAAVEKTETVAIDLLGLTPAEASVMSSAAIATAMLALRGGERLIAAAPPASFGVARAMWADLGGLPSTTRAVAQSGAEGNDAAVRGDLVARFTLLREAVRHAVADLRNAAVPRAASLRRAWSFGVVPTLDAAEQLTYLRAIFGEGGAIAADVAALLDRLAGVAADTMAARLDKVGADAPGPIADLARTITELATPDGKLSLLATWTTATLLATAGLKVDAEDPALDRDWLDLVAAVRPGLARFEALQLSGRHLNTHAPLRAWSSVPGDPWRRAAVKSNLEARNTQAFQPGKFDMPVLVAAYGETQAWAASSVAVGLIDEFGEHVPMEHRTTYAAFGFNAPASRPAQAILLAVPGVPRTRLDEASVLQIVSETRSLAHARAARLEDLGPFQMLMPSPWLRGSGFDRVRLDPSSQFVP